MDYPFYILLDAIANTVLRSFAFVFMRGICLWFSFLVISLVLVLVRVGYRNGRRDGREIPLMDAYHFRG